MNAAVRDLASPAECAARAQRIAAAGPAHQLRQGDLTTSRALARRAGIRTEHELLDAMQAVQACVAKNHDTRLADYAERLRELIADIDAEMITDEATS